MKKYILAITGASGTIIGIRLLDELAKVGEVHLIITPIALKIIQLETGIDLSTITEETLRKKFNTDSLFYYNNDQIWAPIASGSFKTDGMFIVPCSMKTLSAIANGYAETLVERAADVMIKEKRTLVISPREMPLSPIHIENMLKLAQLGVCIAPPIPAFYPRPKSIEEMIDFLVGKILDCMKIENELFNRWGEKI